MHTMNIIINPITIIVTVIINNIIACKQNNIRYFIKLRGDGNS